MKAIVQALVITGFIIGVYLFAKWEPSVQAAAGGSDNCEVLGTIGSVIIGRCIDPDTGREIYGNSQGFIDAIEEY